MSDVPQFQKQNPYNIFAKLISHLRDVASEFFTSSAERNSIEINEECVEAVSQFISKIPELASPNECLHEGISSQGMDAIIRWADSNSKIDIYELLHKLDDFFDWEMIIKSSPVSSMPHFSSLNDNGKETGILIVPRVPAVSDDSIPESRQDHDSDESPSRNAAKRSWANLWDYGMHSDFKNIDYIEVKDLYVGEKHYQVCHTIVYDLFALDTKKILKIAVSPLARDIDLDIEKREVPVNGGTQGLFRIQGVCSPERIHNRVAAAYLWACREQADILVFPEMLADRELLGIGNDYSKMFESFALMAEEDGRSPFLIIGPTIWHDGKNEAYVLDGDGGRLCVQQKQNAFDLNDGGKIWKEDLLSPEPVVQVLHVPGLGRITIPICRDFLVTGYRDLLTKTLHCTLAICPSYSGGKTSFDLAAARDRPFGCYTVWANTCSAYSKTGELPNHIGFVSSPVPGGSEQDLKPKCHGVCGSDTTACLFLIEISLNRVMPRQAKVHPQIQEETNDGLNGKRTGED